MIVDPKSAAQKMRSDILERLVQLAKDAREAKLLIDQLDTVDRMISAAEGRPLNMRYVTCPRPIDAVVRFLTDRGSPATEEEIIAGVFGSLAAVANTWPCTRASTTS